MYSGIQYSEREGARVYNHDVCVCWVCLCDVKKIREMSSSHVLQEQTIEKGARGLGGEEEGWGGVAGVRERERRG